MKAFKFLFLLVAASISVTKISAQANAYLNILTLNSGLVKQGGIVDIQVTVGNTGPVSSITANKVRAQISVPSALVSLLGNAQQTGLPSGWTITVNTGSAITICNGSDVIAINEARTILIKVQGNTIGGPSTVNGNLLFSGGASCTIPGSLSGDNTADNSSTSSIQVYDPIPVKLIDFKAEIKNCSPLLKWTTENELNFDRFEIERGSSNNSEWTSIGSVSSTLTSGTKAKYNFYDNELNSSSEKILYRLKIIDKDGRYEYSEILRVSVNCKTTQLHVYPNPVQNGKLNINLMAAGSISEAMLLSLTGQVILKTRIRNGNNLLDISNIANGMYLLNVKDQNGIYKTVKVFIQR